MPRDLDAHLEREREDGRVQFDEFVGLEIVPGERYVILENLAG